ncbi:MAG: hypothetical protein JXR48_13765 [Candidatus Delongbacteria bacterium]|nr:hypothetical protein [Candidatus Delongbacteria bacterium]MBN2836023.1 hypothetical protein [Candidatus Delongbacteria bacterium]
MNKGNIKNLLLKKEIILSIIIITVSFFTTSYVNFVLIFPFYSIYIQDKKNKTISNLKKNWGFQKEKIRAYQIIDKFHKLNNKSKISIDDYTWNDLNMTSIFELVDRTLTSVGTSLLYDMLRTLVFDVDKLSRRDRLIEKVKNDEGFRLEIQYELNKLGIDETGEITDLVFDKNIKNIPYNFVFSIQYFLVLLSFVSIIFLSQKAIFIILPITIINMFTSYYFMRYYAHLIPSLRYLAKLMKTAISINKNREKELIDYDLPISESIKLTQRLRSKLRFLILPVDVSVLEYLSIYYNLITLKEVRTYCAAINQILKYQDHLKKIYEFVGTIDSLQSVASYRIEFYDHCNPNFTHDENSLLFCRNIYHPSVQNPIKNEIFIKNNGIIITGSNMAGKSTFLRAIGLNTILAQTLFMCHADYFSLGFMNVSSSINQVDDVKRGKSFYYTEAERLLTLISNSNQSFRTLIIIDEMLKGTNSKERQVASLNILKYLKNQNSLVITATHDLTLAQMLDKQFDNFHFTDDVNSSGLNFDYKLKEGISDTTNALKMLKILGFPDEFFTN